MDSGPLHARKIYFVAPTNPYTLLRACGDGSRLNGSSTGVNHRSFTRNGHRDGVESPRLAKVLPTAWSALDQTTIERIAPQHSNQVFNRIAGSWVSRGNGQESLISLRSPVLTGAGSCGSFITAQDGISMRSPGFCNVNQLFDANLLQAGKVEVLKGPATVVFGSNALHGIINVLTRSGL